MLNQSIHIVSNTIPGYTLLNGKYPTSRREALLLSPFIYYPRTLSVSCKSNNNHRRNPDFSRHQRGSSRGRNKNYQERGNSENQDESDPLTSKNGSLLSLSSNQRYSATSAPGRREKEIVELFRKVQAQLRERAAIKEEQKIEASQQGQQGERGTVDSLLNLLRKHSVAQNKKSSREEEFNVDETERSDLAEEEQSASFLGSDENAEADTVQSSRPASSFRRRSPVPRVKFQPVFLKSEEKEKDDVDEPEQELVTLEEIDDTIYDDEDESKEENDEEESAKENTDLASLKLVELKEIAKSRGVKGYSKMKKSEIVELLSADGS